MRRLLLALAVSLSCRPDLGDRDSLIQRTQILAVRGEPAEVKTGETATYTLLVATPEGPLLTPIADWAFCATPKLLTENGVASALCLGQGVRPIAEGPAAVSAPIPPDACGLFGPEVTSAELRPRDPDVTGGFYQPVRASVLAGSEAVVAFGLERIDCKLANASADATADYAKRHKPNANPALGPLTLTVGGGAPGGARLDAVPRGAAVVFRATWPEAAAERYVVYDPASAAVVEHRESMRLSWYATAGAFENDRTGRAETESETFTENGWAAPDAPGTFHLFVVLRDARGGVGFATYAVVVN